MIEGIPIDWDVISLGEVCKRGGGNIQTGPFGSQLHASDYVASGIPSIMPQNIGDNRVVTDGIARINPNDAERLERYLVLEGDIVYSRRGDVERRALIRNDEIGWLCGTGCLRVRVGTYVDPLYASYYLGHPRVREWIVNHAVGATMRNLNTAILSALPFVVPPRHTQRRIAEILGALDDKIELNRRMNETLEKLARAVFREATRDCDAWVPAGEVAHINAQQLRSGDGVGVVDYVEISEVSQGDVANVVRYARGTEPSRAKRRLQHGDTVMSTVRPDRGSYFLALEPAATIVVSTGFAVLSPTTVPWSFLHVALTEPDVFAELGRLADGGAYPAVRSEVIGSLEIPQMSKPQLDRFHDIVAPLYSKMEQNRRESRTLAQLRDTLLPQLLSGELPVADAETNAAEVI